MTGENFGSAAQIYFDAGWKPIPGKKEEGNTPAVNRHSGRTNLRVADQSKLGAWKNQFRDSSVNLRLWDVEGEAFEIIGIDVDHYDGKKGYEYLLEVEKELGKLPPTWRSSSRGSLDENPSGIRFYKVPLGLNFWDLGNNVDCIWKGNRYATAWPSVSGKTGRSYRWYGPDDSLADVGVVPTVWELPELPDAWVDRLTKQREEFFSFDEVAGLDVGELDKWIEETLVDFYGDMCDCVRKVFDKWVKVFDDTLEHHEPQKRAIWQLCNMALEQHQGCGTAIEKYIEEWIEDVGRREKRDFSEARREIGNSYSGAMRKLFGKELKENECGLTNNVIPIFAQFMSGGDSGDSGSGSGSGDGSSGSGLLPACDYEPNDDGNGLHMFHTFNTEDGSTICFVKDYDKDGKWIIWDKELQRWVLDVTGNLIRDKWRVVKNRQQRYWEAVEQQYVLTKARAAANPPMNQNIDYLEALAEYNKWKVHINNSGNNRNALEAIKNAGTHATVVAKELDSNKNVLGVANGVIRFGEQAKLDNAKMSDFIVMNTNVPLLTFADVNPVGEKLWNEFLDLALPNRKYRMMAQMAAGYCLFGGNPGRHIIFCLGGTTTGKSTFVNALCKSLGDYAAPVSKTLFQSKQFPVALWANQKKRLLVNSEFDTLTRVSSAIFKELAGNTDSQSAEIKREMRTDVVEPEFTLMVATNKLPAFHDVDLATKKRFYIIPFNETLPDKGEVAAELLEVGRDSILQWAVEGYNMYRKNGGLHQDDETRGFIDEAMQEIDPYTAFINDEFEAHPMYKEKMHWREWVTKNPEWCMSKDVVYELYCNWWRQQGYQEKDRLEKNGLSRRLSGWGLKDTSYTSLNSQTGRFWVGIRRAEISNLINFPHRGR